MNVVDGLQTIRDRLADQGANSKTLSYVDTILERAKTPGANTASAPSLSHLVKMLLRNPISQGNTAIYNDLAKLEESLGVSAAALAAQRAAEESKPLPKSKKYYQELKEKQKKQNG